MKKKANKAITKTRQIPFAAAKNLLKKKNAGLKKELKQNMQECAGLRAKLKALSNSRDSEIKKIQKNLAGSHKIVVDNLQLEKKSILAKAGLLETINIKLREDYYLKEDKFKKEIVRRALDLEGIKLVLEEKIKAAEEALQKEKQLFECNLRSARAEADKYRMELSIRKILDEDEGKENGDQKL